MNAQARRWHVERAGCWAAGPFDAPGEAFSWIQAQPRTERSELQVRQHPTWSGLLDDPDSGPDDGCARWIAGAVVAFVLTITALWLHGAI